MSRTAIFNSFANLSSDFHDHFRVLWNIDHEERSRLIPSIVKIAQAHTTGEARAIKEKAVASIKVPASEALKAVSLLLYFYQQWNPVKDTPEDFLRDLAELNLVPADKGQEAKDFLLEFLSVIQQDNRRRLEKMYGNSLLPSYSGVVTLVDMRAVFQTPFGANYEDQVDEYRPKCVGFVPVVIVKLTRDTGEAQPYVFQCERDGLERLISALQAAIKDLDSARSAFLSEMQK